MTIPLTALLLLIVAAGLGTLVRWIAQRLSAADWVCFFLGLFVFGLILTFFKVS